MSFLADETPAQQAASILIKHVKDRLAMFARDYKRAFDMVWNRTDGVTPQEVLDAIGTDGILLFTQSARTRDYFLAVKPSLLSAAYMEPPLPVAPEIVDGQPTGRMIVG